MLHEFDMRDIPPFDRAAWISRRVHDETNIAVPPLPPDWQPSDEPSHNTVPVVSPGLRRLCFIIIAVTLGLAALCLLS